LLSGSRKMRQGNIHQKEGSAREKKIRLSRKTRRSQDCHHRATFGGGRGSFLRPTRSKKKPESKKKAVYLFQSRRPSALGKRKELTPKTGEESQENNAVGKSDNPTGKGHRNYASGKGKRSERPRATGRPSPKKGNFQIEEE